MLFITIEGCYIALSPAISMIASSVKGSTSVGERMTVFVLRVSALYLLTIAALTMLAPELMTNLLGGGRDPTCYPWIRYIGPMLAAFGGALLAVRHEPSANPILLRSVAVFALVQVLLDISLVICNGFRYATMAVDAVILSMVALTCVGLERSARRQRNKFKNSAVNGVHRPKHLQATLVLVSGYLFLGGICALLLPQLMNRVLNYSLGKSCIPWVQLTGPPAIGMALAFAFAAWSPASNVRAVMPLAMVGCVIELCLDVFIIWDDSFKFWPVLADMVIVGAFLVSLVIAWPYVYPRDSSVGARH